MARVGSPSTTETTDGSRLEVLAAIEAAVPRRKRKRDKSAVAIRLLWVVIVSIHWTCCLYYAAVAMVYYKLPVTLVSAHLQAYELTLSMNYFPVVVGFHVVCSMLHALFLLEMLYFSARQRKLYFRRHLQNFTFRGPSRRSLVRDVAVMPTPRIDGVGKKALSAWESSFGVHGFFGVGGKHFAMLFLFREAFETILQSMQAYYLSRYVPRVWLNRFAVGVVTVGCWSTPAIQHAYSQYPRLQLTLCLLVDVTLDFVSSIGVSVALAMRYFRDYDPTLTNFKLAKWSDVVWLANMNNEVRLLFVQSWADFVCRALFATTLLICLDDVKLLAAASKMLTRRKTETSPANLVRVGWDCRLKKVVHITLFVWGWLILAFHLGSSSGIENADCLVRVHPWLSFEPSCVYLQINCQQHAGMTGQATEIETIWSQYSSQALTTLLLTSCPDAHMPPSIRTLTQLTSIYLVDVNLTEWSENSALSKYWHPNLRQVSMVRANMSASCYENSSLPPGLITPGFPSTMGTLFIAGSGVTDLPANLAEVWPPDLNMILIGNEMTVIPDVLIRLAPSHLSVPFNQIQHVPAEVFELPSLKWLELDWNPINELPADATVGSSLLEIGFTSTNVSSLPSWMTHANFLSKVKVFGAMTPYCWQLEAKQDTESAHLASLYCRPR